jgi:excisionase family DNA binding protein
MCCCILPGLLKRGRKTLGMSRCLVTIKEAARVLGVSEAHVKRLIHEADINRKSRWRFGREIIDLTPIGSERRTLRINVDAVLQGQRQGQR